MLAAAAMFLAYFPVASGWLAVGLAVYASLLWRDPLLWLFAVPALLPILDLAGWSGWFFFDEFDLLLLVTLAVLLVRSDQRLTLPPLPRSAKWLIGLFTLSYAVSLLRGLLPLAPIDANAFASYYSPYNALRLGKSWLWVLVFLPYLRRALKPEGSLSRYLLPGLLVGLAGTMAFGLWERWLFPGLGDVAAAYRVTAFFSSMHVGGCSIDIYLALAVPVVAACFLVWRGLAVYTAGLLLFAGSVYLVLVTFSRGTYLAIPVASLVLLAGAMSERSWRISIGKALLPLVLTVIVLGLPILLGPYAQERFSTFSRDMQTRINLWREALEFRDDTVVTSLLGMGIGSFPRAYLWADPGPSRPATFRYVSEGSTFLRLGSGTPLYILQRIRLSEEGQYKVSARLRSNSADAQLRVLVCEKSLLYSYACKLHDWTVAAPDWKDYGASLDLSQFADNLRPVWLSFSNTSHNAVIDIDDLRLEGPDGRQVLSNGDFERGHDRWFFTSEDHIAWHTKNLWVHILFEQGWIGMILFATLTAYALVHLTRRARARDSIALVLLAPLVATLSISPVYTTLDTPRIALLWYWLLVIAAIYSTPLAHSHEDSRTVRSL